MSDLIHYRVWVNATTNTVRLEASGFETEEDAIVFANWLSELPMGEEGDISVH